MTRRNIGIGTCVALLILALLASCGGKRKQYPPQQIIRLDKAIEEYPAMSLEARAEMIDSMAPGLDALFQSMGITEASDSLLEMYAESAIVGMFMPEIDEAFPSLDSLQAVIGTARGIAAEQLPSMQWPEIYASVLTSRDRSIYTDGEVMLLGLNHYLGPGHPAYDGFPNYVKRVKTPEMIPVNVAEAVIGTAYPYAPTADATLLNRLLYEGATLYAMSVLLPDTPEARVLGFAPEELDWLNGTEAAGWNKLISNQYLYSTDPTVADRLLSPAPVTAILNPMAPGRAGRYYGYRIVSSYMKNNPSATLDQILSPDFYNSPQTLIDAKYAPR